MQEEVEQRIVSLMISCGKLGEQEFRKAVAKLLEQLKNGHQKYQHSKANPHGKMTVKQLAAKDKGLQSIEIRISAHSTGSPGSMALTSLHSRSRAKSGTWCSSKRRTPTP